MKDRAQKLKNEIHTFNLKIDRLQKQFENIPLKARDEFNKTILEIKEKRNQLKNQVNSIIKATEDAGEDLQVGSELLRKDVESAYNSAKTDFKMAYRSAKERFIKLKKAS